MRPRALRVLFVVAPALCMAAATAGEFAVGGLRVDGPHARATPPGARAATAYFTVENRGAEADRLIGVRSPVAAVAEMHTMSMDGNVMRMRSVRSVDIPARGKVAFAPGGLHVMLIDLKRPLAAGERIPLTLTFERGGALDVSVSVEPMTPAGADAMHPH
jgi:copper(I)-binding protein